MPYKDINEAIHNKDYSVVKTFKAGGFASRFLFTPPQKKKKKSLLLPPVRYFKTSITSAMKIKIANMVWSSCSYYFIQLGFRTHEPCAPTNCLGIIVLLFIFVLTGNFLFESFLFIFFCLFLKALNDFFY